jgi:hypothetical protein
VATATGEFVFTISTLWKVPDVPERNETSALNDPPGPINVPILGRPETTKGVSLEPYPVILAGSEPKFVKTIVDCAADF